MDFLRRQVLELQRAGQQQGQFAAGYGPITAGQGLIMAGPGQSASGQGKGQGEGEGQGQGPNAVNMIETENVGSLASALDDLTYEDDKQYENVLAWDGPDPKPADKRKRAVSDESGCFEGVD